MGQCEFSGKVRKPVMLLEYEVANRTWQEEIRKLRRKGRRWSRSVKVKKWRNEGGRGDNRAEI
jgi:hypothetical protein